MKRVPFDLETFKKCGKAETRDGIQVFFVGLCESGERIVIERRGGFETRFLDGKVNATKLPYCNDLTHCLVESKRRPYKSIEEVPVDHWFRMKGSRSPHRLTGYLDTICEVVLGGNSQFGFSVLSDKFEHSPTISGPWEPCTVEDCE